MHHENQSSKAKHKRQLCCETNDPVFSLPIERFFFTKNLGTIYTHKLEKTYIQEIFTPSNLI